jgi:hypothetical protein
MGSILYQVDADGLESDPGELVQEAGHDEVDLAEGGNNNTEDNERDIEKLHEVDLLNSEQPTSQENRDGGGGLHWSAAVVGVWGVSDAP